jgi:polysaccharide export outer membrane protein
MLKRIFIFTLTAFFLMGMLGTSYGQQDYCLGAEDQIEIRVWNHDDLVRRVRIGLDGNISFPFVGEIKARGLTVSELQKEIERRLGPKFIVDPRVSISVAEFKSQKFFVVGNVQKPGTYPLTKPIKVVEAISQAGVLHGETGKAAGGGGVAIIIRAKPGEMIDQPKIPSQSPENQKVTVSLSKALSGDSQHNVEIKNGDTIYVPTLIFYVSGEVKKPDRYVYEENLTVLMAVTAAGGFTDKASVKRTFIIREQSGLKQKVKVGLEDPILPGDNIVVPESWF